MPLGWRYHLLVRLLLLIVTTTAYRQAVRRDWTLSLSFLLARSRRLGNQPAPLRALAGGGSSRLAEWCNSGVPQLTGVGLHPDPAGITSAA